MDGVQALVDHLMQTYPFLTARWAQRLIRAYGTDAETLLAGAETKQDLGVMFGADLTEREVTWLMQHEYAQTAEDVIWRRSKLGLRMSADEISALRNWMEKKVGT